MLLDEMIASVLCGAVVGAFLRYAGMDSLICIELGVVTIPIALIFMNALRMISPNRQ